jgi:hypothetical protein
MTMMADHSAFMIKKLGSQRCDRSAASSEAKGDDPHSLNREVRGSSHVASEDVSTGDAYYSEAPDPTSDIFGSPCLLIYFSNL